MVQHVLNSANFSAGDEDGIYGPLTAEAVRQFQRSQGLPVDGLVGPQTWVALAQATPEGERLRKMTLHGLLHGATSGADVAAAQDALLSGGFDPGVVDGIYGPRTESAVKEFQATEGLTADGIVDALTWAALTRPSEADGAAAASSAAGPTKTARKPAKSATEGATTVSGERSEADSPRSEPVAAAPKP
jgi:peptidoglycan hydrolase-like protein with peptidoglycan-binding domain